MTDEEFTCLECGSHKTPKMHKSREEDGEVTWVECRDCGHEYGFRS
jgi:transcription elongation factor Elf1